MCGYFKDNMLRKAVPRVSSFNEVVCEPHFISPFTLTASKAWWTALFSVM